MWLRVALPTACLFVLAFGGYVKGTPLFAGLPFDITLVAAGGVLIASIHRVLTPGRRYPGAAICLILLLVASMMLGLTTPPVNSYATGKQFDILVIVPACIIGGMLLLDSKSSRRLWLVFVVLFGPFVVITALLDPSPLSAGRLFPVGGSTIGVGRATGAALVVVWGVLLSRGKTRTAVALLPVLAGALVLSGSRGPLAAALLSMAAMAMSSASRSRRGAAWALIGSFFVLIGALIAGVSAPARLTSLADASASLRFKLWDLTLGLGLDHPLNGIGWGNLRPYQDSSELLASGNVQYPHNLALEVASEAGLIALCALLLLILVATQTQWREAKLDAIELGMFGLLLFFLINALASADVGGNRGLWIALGCAWGAHRALSSKAHVASTDASARRSGDRAADAEAEH